MNKTISYRPIKRSDYDKLEDIIIETWNYDKFGNKKTAKALARVFLASCLTNQNFTSVALINNEPVGVIMGKSEKKHPILFYYHLHQFISIIKMISFQEGRKVLKMFEGFEKINKELSKSQGVYISLYPNAGLPNSLGEYDETPEETASLIKELASEGHLNIVGGCCGTTYNHIKAISEVVSNFKPRLKPLIEKESILDFCNNIVSSLKSYLDGNFLSAYTLFYQAMDKIKGKLFIENLGVNNSNIVHSYYRVATPTSFIKNSRDNLHIPYNKIE
ncbi:MAG: homocysteine S-methyltransferase family protein, partial [Erysipelotrichaceae bacterium]